MRRIDGVGVVLVVLFGLCGVVSAAESGIKDPAAARAFLKELVATRDTAAQVEALITKLAHDEARVRESATKELIALGPAAAPLVGQAAKSDDPEVRWRAGRVLAAHKAAPQDASAEMATAIDLVAAAKDKWVVGALIQLFDHPRDDVRYGAEYGLRRATGQCFGYNAYAEHKERAAAAARWRAWWKESAATFEFGARPAPAPKVAGILISSRGHGEVRMVSLKGEVVGVKEIEGRVSCAIALGNGNTIVAKYLHSATVEEYDPDGRVVWSTKGLELRGSVMDVQRLPNGNTLIAHTSGSRVIEVDRKGTIVWMYRAARSPYGARRLANGNTLVCLYSRPSKVVEVTRGSKAVWSTHDVSSPTSAAPLPNGNVLIADYRNQRVIEVNRERKIVWQRKCVGRPFCACRLPDGTTVISDTSEGVILVGKDGTLIRQLDAHGAAGRICIVPAAPPRENER